MKIRKALLSAVLAALVVLMFIPATSAGASSSAIGVTIDGTPVIFPDMGPVIRNNRTLTPVRVFEQLGFEVNWDGNARRATCSNADYVIVFTIGSNSYTINGARHALDVPPQLIGGRTMLPVRLPLEEVGFFVDWIGSPRTVIIGTTPVEEGTFVTIRGVRYSLSLTELSLSFLELTNADITPLRYMTNLTSLSLDYNLISDLTPLSGLTNLTSLHLNANQISNLSPLSGLAGLTVLSLEANQIVDLTPLSGLRNLQELYLFDNQITNWTHVAHVASVDGRPVG